MSTSIHNLPSRRRCSESWWHLAPHLPDEQNLGRREVGSPVTNHRTSWVRRLDCPAGGIFVKTYSYDGWIYHLRSLGRWTAPWRRGRATREYDALVWLRSHGFSAPEPLLVLERRHLGMLRSATLVTREFPGEQAAATLPNLAPQARRAALTAIVAMVTKLHESGFRDGNLDLRNLLLRRTASGDFDVAKIDSPRYRIRRAGTAPDRLTRADWQRLRPQLEALEASSTTVTMGATGPAAQQPSAAPPTGT